MHLPPSIFQAPKQPVIRPCSGLLGSWGGRISKFRTTTGGSWKPPSHLTGPRPQQLHFVAVCATGWTASRTQWQSYGQIPTTSRRPWLSRLHWAHLIIGRTTGYKYFSILHIAGSPIAHWMKPNLFSTRTFGRDDPPRTPKIITRNNLAWLTNLRDSLYPYYYRYPMLGFPLFFIFLMPILHPIVSPQK